MDTSLTESRDRIRQAIDDEINSWQESTRALRSRRNALAPISRLSPETLASIFFLLSFPRNGDNFSRFWEPAKSPLMRVAHVCRRWRETALNNPHFWSHINFTKLKPLGMAEIVARAKMAPLDLQANVFNWSREKFDVFERQLEVHVSQIRSLSIHGQFQTTLQRLVSPAPTLESLSLSYYLSGSHQVDIPDDLFNSTAPSLKRLELDCCDISWKSPLLKGLRSLKIRRPSAKARPELKDWLNALNEMPKLETLILESASLPVPLVIPELLRAITLPFLTDFRISAPANDCVLALTHLVMPALIWQHVDVESYGGEGEDAHRVLPYIVRNVYGLLETKPLRSIQIQGSRRLVVVHAWTLPNADRKFYDVFAPIPANLMFTARGKWLKGVGNAILDALLTLLPVNSVSAFTVRGTTKLCKEFWLSHMPRLPLLERVLLVPSAVKVFRALLGEDAPPDGPRLPSLTKLTLINLTLTGLRTYDLQDMLMERVEQGVSLEVLDLRLCFASYRAIQLLRETVVEVCEPSAWQMTVEEPDSCRGIGSCDEVEYDDRRDPFYDIDYEDSDEDTVECDNDGDWEYYDYL